LEVAVAEISSAEVSKNFSRYREIADGSRGAPEPVLVLHYNKPSVVIVAAEEYARLKRRDRVAGATEDLPEWLARRIAEVPNAPTRAAMEEARAMNRARFATPEALFDDLAAEGR
jgi:PHD/YefM family antitoxin component YafN of YafNO toxin-antitoxin module